jgi:hypothetical protein
MFESEDGYLTGSIDVSKLDEVEPKSDEARAQLVALKAEAKASAEQAAADAERLAALHEAQSAQGQAKGRETVTRQAGRVPDPNAAKAADQKAADQKAATTARPAASASSSGKQG